VAQLHHAITITNQPPVLLNYVRLKVCYIKNTSSPLSTRTGGWFVIVICSMVAWGFMVDNHPSARAKPEGEGVVIDHKSLGYCAVTIIYPT